jgi:uncharacterized protein YbjT (DUF2867 family)
MKKILVAGASGLIGVNLLRQSAAHSEIEPIAVLRKPLKPSIAGVEEVICDFDHLDKATLPSANVAVCCLGTTIKVAGSQAAFQHVDLDLVVAFARAAKKAGVGCFVLVSAAGASQQSRVFYSRVKGEAEVAVEQLGFDSLIIARPSLLLGDRDALAQPQRGGESIAQRVGRLLAPITPLAYRPITDHHLARVLLTYALAAPPGSHVIDSKTLHSR